LFPKLTTVATNPEALEVKQQTYDGYYSSTKTCEIAMSEAVKENYESILYLVDELLQFKLFKNLNFILNKKLILFKGRLWGYVSY
jgi:hypothetical protein